MHTAVAPAESSSAETTPLRNVFMTNINGSNEDVMVFSHLDADTLRRAYLQSGALTFDECYEVKDNDVQFYLYEACHLNAKEEQRARELAEIYTRSGKR